ncbi:COP1-interacting protein-related, putative isoform 3 [Hibiscus syriacus]|uniref:COP1-interacting protein-related, putative isoform 3 n=1 Tax=Hibiscus syriacus TaxID=106335 RepID=A0A6A3D2Z0_HIBSY|nr:COP1-interacting protein-related, putative isoform 3 [Hibiscus syriacus]
MPWHPILLVLTTREQPDARPPEANGSSVQQGNPKAQLLKVLETRKTVLQKEQGMAFARAVAAGFNIDEMTPLISFSERFGASRLRDACVKLIELWKRKHEDGKWLEIEATEAMAGRSDFSAMKELKGAWPGISENNGNMLLSQAQMVLVSDAYGKRRHLFVFSMLKQVKFRYRHMRSLPWINRPLLGKNISRPGFRIPCFLPGLSNLHLVVCQLFKDSRARHVLLPTLSSISPFFQQPYPSMEDPKLDDGRRIQRIHSMYSQNGSDAWKLERAKPQDDRELENETSVSPKSRKKSSRSGKKQPGTVVIRNINYITPKKRNSSDGDMGGQWQAFQNYLLRGAEEEEHKMDQGIFSTGKQVQGKRRPNRAGEDPLVSGGREMGQYKERNTTNMHESGGRMLKAPSNDHSLISKNGDHSVDGRILIDGLHYMEADGRRVYRSSMNDDFIVDKQKNQSDFMNSHLDPLAVNGFERSLNKTDDDSYIVPFRSTSVTQVETDNRNAINMDSEFSLSLQKAGTTSNRVGSHVNYETKDLTLMPQRGTEMGSIGYDPALDYEMQARAVNGTSLDKQNKEGMKGSKKPDIRKPKLIADPLDKKKTVGPIRKEKPSKMSPLDEAKARAERLRNYKADLQKMKKEKQEAEIRRLEALKMERQKRIAARSSSSIPAQSSMAAQSRKQMPLKLSPSSHKGSKFTDAEPGLSSPLQRSIRTPPVGSPASLKTPKPSKLNTGTNSRANKVSKSAPSLPVLKKDTSSVTPDAKATMARIRRLSEPKINGSTRVPSVKPGNSEPSSKKVFRRPESRKISAIVNYDNSKIASLPDARQNSDYSVG